MEVTFHFSSKFVQCYLEGFCAIIVSAPKFKDSWLVLCNPTYMQIPASPGIKGTSVSYIYVCTIVLEVVTNYSYVNLVYTAK